MPFLCPFNRSRPTLIKLRPEWAEEALKVVMTGSAEDGPEWQKHIRSKDARRKLANRFKDAKDPFKIVIVRDMWLTGFDAPCLHTMYADKPMQGHGRGMSNQEFRMSNGLNFVIRTSAFALRQPRRSGAHPRTGRRQETLDSGGDGVGNDE